MSIPSSLLSELFDIGAIRTASDGSLSINLKSTVSYPALLSAIADALHALIRPLHFHLLCGTPYTAISFATALSLRYSLPMVIQRKLGRRLLEGVYQGGQKVLVIGGAAASGGSLLRTAHLLRQEGLLVEDAAVLIHLGDETQELTRHGIRLHSVYRLFHLLNQSCILPSCEIPQHPRPNPQL